jgi:tetratricopeptide (TPR) repeat protein
LAEEIAGCGGRKLARASPPGGRRLYVILGWDRAAHARDKHDGGLASRRARGEKDPSWKKLIDIARQADADAWRNRCREALLRGDRQALEQLADSLPIGQVPPTTAWQLGSDLMKLGAKDKAMELLLQAQHEYPDDWWLNDCLGWFCLTKFQPPLYDDALRFYSVTLALRPGQPVTHDVMAQIWTAKGRVNEAIAEYSKEIELDPQNPGACFERGIAYYQIQQYEKAAAD